MNCTGQDGKLWRVHTEVVLSAASSEDCHGSAAQLWLARPPRSPLPKPFLYVRSTKVWSAADVYHIIVTYRVANITPYVCN